MKKADIINNTYNKKFNFSIVPKIEGKEEYIKEVSKWFK
jgi:hypothetical protein